MKNIGISFLIILLVCSCYNRRYENYVQEQQRRQDSINAQIKQMKGDDDGDGVINHYDKCGNTPLNSRVDSKGCPMDVDNDGVIDLYDNCVTVAGTKDNGGCPEE